LERILTDNGFLLVRQRGSHRVFTDGIRTVSVPAHGKDIAVGTLARIIRDSSLPKELSAELG
jgi:predicted RNA binding protein YcfA (HicA-like mRNA interferase family)